jgi:transposase
MTSYMQGVARDQATLFPQRLDELIAAESLVRVVDEYVNLAVDVRALGFEKAVPERTGRPAYDPRDLLKLYLYGYLNRTRSSRRLEQECHRNVEVLWLLRQLRPDFKTIADFRRDNRAALVKVCRGFVEFCRSQQLFGAELVAIDGSKFAGQNSPQRAYTRGQIKKAGEELDKRIAKYLAQLDEADAAEPAGEVTTGDARAALAALQEKRADIAQKLLLMEAMNLTQVTSTDPDTRLMRGARGGIVVGYNVQVAVDSQHGLIAHHAVTQDASDQNQLAAVAEGAKEALGVEQLDVTADAGYGDAQEFQRCEDKAITPYVPHPRSVNTRGEFFDKSRFVYQPESDTYRCPAGKTLRFHSASIPRQASNYVGIACEGCAVKAQCTTADARWVTRHRHEGALERAAARMKQRPGIMKQRGALVEHPFGIIKAMMGFPRFLCRGLPAVAAEMALSVTAFNLKRLATILGVDGLLRRLAAA